VNGESSLANSVDATELNPELLNRQQVQWTPF
jgi:hypothetical protein